MAKNQTTYAINYFLLQTGMTREELARKILLSRQMFSLRMRYENFTDFEKAQLTELGIDFTAIVK
jgi:hypothetical protein